MQYSGYVQRCGDYLVLAPLSGIRASSERIQRYSPATVIMATPTTFVPHHHHDHGNPTYTIDTTMWIIPTVTAKSKHCSKGQRWCINTQRIQTNTYTCMHKQTDTNQAPMCMLTRTYTHTHTHRHTYTHIRTRTHTHGSVILTCFALWTIHISPNALQNVI